jgi:hypothetical protein
MRPREASDQIERLLPVDVNSTVCTADKQVVEVGVDAVGSLGVQLDDGTKRPRLVLELTYQPVRCQCVCVVSTFARSADHVAKVAVFVLVENRCSTLIMLYHY